MRSESDMLKICNELIDKINELKNKYKLTNFEMLTIKEFINFSLNLHLMEEYYKSERNGDMYA